MTTRIGVDFGTANTVVARWDDALDRGEPVPLDGIDLVREAGAGVTQRVIPSLIAYAADGAHRWIGSQVMSRRELLDDPAVSVFQATKSNLTGRAADIPREVGEHKVTGRDAATQFLGDVMAMAVLAVGSDDLEIVATAPVETFDTYRDWLVRDVAGDTATRLRVVDEATAAAVGYRARMSPGDPFCVFDFGAGTLDITIVLVEDPAQARGGAGVRVISKIGLDLGGNHIDALLAERAAQAAQPASLPRGDAVGYNRVFRRLLASAEDAKIALGRTGRAVIRAADPVTGTTYSHEISRGDFEQLLRDRDILGRAGRGLRKALDGAAARGFGADTMAGVFLTGGSCLIPAVQEVVRLQFDPSLVHLDRPLEAVAAGAAGIAGGQELHDHIQHDYEIRHVAQTGEYQFEPLVRAGTSYPTAEPVRTLTLKAIHHGQRRMGINIYERAHDTWRDDSADVEIIYDAGGGARTVAVSAQQRQERVRRWLNEDSPTFLEVDPPAAAGAARFSLEFRIDAQKRLTVSAFDLERRIWVLDRQPVVRLA